MTAELELPNKPRILPGCEIQGYEALNDETSSWIDAGTIQGEIPADIEGTLFLSCVGRNKIGGQQFGH